MNPSTSSLDSASAALGAWLGTNPAELAEARARIASASTVVIVTHVSPDGDAVGSLLGLGWALRNAGKQATLVCEDGVPDVYSFLPGADQVVKRIVGPFDLAAAVDCADAERMGAPGLALGRAPDLNIDHHVTNTHFARLNFVAAEAASTSEIILHALEPLGLALDQNVAECLLTGLVTDTIGFSTPNVTPKTLTSAQTLMRAGADLSRLYALSLNTRSFHSARLWAEGLIRLEQNDGIVWTAIPLEARKASGYQGSGDADLANFLGTIRGARVAIVIGERKPGEIKVSWRSNSGLDVSALAEAFGGGGHAAAAGAEVHDEPLGSVTARVLEATRKALDNDQ